MPYVIRQDEYATLWYHPGPKVVHHKIHRFIPAGIFQEILTAGAVILEQDRASKWLADDSENTVVRNGDLNLVYELAENTSRENGGMIFETLCGLSVGLNDILVGFGYLGNPNLDEQATTDDYFVVDMGLGEREVLRSDNSVVTGVLGGDLNGDGQITTDDYFFIDLWIG